MILKSGDEMDSSSEYQVGNLTLSV